MTHPIQRGFTFEMKVRCEEERKREREGGDEFSRGPCPLENRGHFFQVENRTRTGIRRFLPCRVARHDLSVKRALDNDLYCLSIRSSIICRDSVAKTAALFKRLNLYCTQATLSGRCIRAPFHTDNHQNYKLYRGVRILFLMRRLEEIYLSSTSSSRSENVVES